MITEKTRKSKDVPLRVVHDCMFQVAIDLVKEQTIEEVKLAGIVMSMQRIERSAKKIVKKRLREKLKAYRNDN